MNDLGRWGWNPESILAIQKLEEVCLVQGRPLGDFGYVLCEHDERSRVIFYRTTPPETIKAVMRLDEELSLEQAIAYADGSGTQIEKRCSIGVVIYRPWSNFGPKFISENVGNGTNNIAELLAIWRVLRDFPFTYQPIEIHTDSEYASGILTLRNWVPKKNIQLVMNIRQDLGLRPNVKIIHVDGHAGVPGNEMADCLAGMSRKYNAFEVLYEGLKTGIEEGRE